MEKEPFKTRHPLTVLFWSFGIFILAHMTQYVYMLLVSKIGGIKLSLLLKGEFVEPRTIVLKGVIVLVLGIPVTFAAVKYLWRRDKKWMCSLFNSKLFLYGILLGIGLPLLIIGIIALLGSVNIVGTPSRFSTQELAFILAGNLFYILFIGILEEYVFRGMAMREWAARWGWWPAVIASGVYFGAAHLLATLPQVTVWYFLKTTLMITVASLLFAAMYIRSRSLWLPIGFHVGWNFCMKAVLGTITSGNNSTYGLYETVIKGPELVTGGEFGMELSIVTLVIYVILAIVFIKFPGKANKGKQGLLEPEPNL